jgi:hypothetical protein
MSGGIGGTVKASIEVESASAVAQLTALAKKFDSVEAAVKAASSSMDKQGMSAKALERAQAALTTQLLAKERVAKRSADQLAAAEARAEKAAERSVDAMIRANQRKMASDKKRAEAAEAARAREEKSEQRRITKQGETAAAKALRDEARAAKEADGAWIKYAATLYTIHNAASLVGRSFMAVYDAAAEGAKIQAAQQFFENAGKSIESYRQATNGMISDAELMKKANLADSMGIDEDTFKKLVVVAEASALKTGQSFDHMFNSIIVGTARSSRLLLDNLGIIVSVEQANQKYASAALAAAHAKDQSTSAVNKFIEAMSAEEKQLAFVREVAEKSKATTSEYNAILDKTAQNFARLEAETQNAADAIKMALTNSFTVALGPLTQLMQTVSELASELGRMNATPIAAGGLLGGLLGFAAAGPWGALIGGVGGASVGLGAAMDAQDRQDALDSEMGQEMTRQLRLMEEYSDALGQQGNVLEVALSTGTSAALEMARDASFGSSELYKAFTAAQARFSELNDKLGQPFRAAPSRLTTSSSGANPPPTSSGGSVGGLGYDDKGRAGAFATQTEWDDEAEDMAKKAKQLQENVDALVGGLEQAAGVLSEAEIDKIVADMDKKMEKVRADAANLPADVQKIIDDMRAEAQANMHKLATVVDAVGGVVVGLANALKDGIIGVTNAMISGDGVFSALADAAAGLISALGQAVNNVASKVGRALAGLTLGISEVIAEPLGALFATAAEGAAAMASAMGRFADTLKPFLDAAEYFKDIIYAVGQMVGDSFAPFIKVVRELATFFGRLIQQFDPFGRMGETLTQVFRILQGAIEYTLGLFLFYAALLNQGGWAFALKAFEGGLWLIAEVMQFAGDIMLRVGAGVNNFVTWLARKIPGMGDFGAYIDVDALKVEFDPRPMDDLTEATRENTAALRDFAREFRNLPANFKAEGYIFDSAAGLRQGDRLGMGTNNQRTRT